MSWYFPESENRNKRATTVGGTCMQWQQYQFESFKLCYGNRRCDTRWKLQAMYALNLFDFLIYFIVSSNYLTFFVTPLTDMPCCGHSRSPICRETCRNILEIGETMQEIIDTLSKGGCGPPLPHEPLWQCFLSGNHHSSHSTSADGTLISQINQIGIDSAKLHCCHKALSPKCRRLCSQTFSNDWTETRSDFENDCYSELNEISLRQCLDEGKYQLTKFHHTQVYSWSNWITLPYSWRTLWARLWWSFVLHKFQQSPHGVIQKLQFKCWLCCPSRYSSMARQSSINFTRIDFTDQRYWQMWTASMAGNCVSSTNKTMFTHKTYDTNLSWGLLWFTSQMYRLDTIGNTTHTRIGLCKVFRWFW